MQCWETTVCGMSSTPGNSVFSFLPENSKGLKTVFIYFLSEFCPFLWKAVMTSVHADTEMWCFAWMIIFLVFDSSEVNGREDCISKMAIFKAEFCHWKYVCIQRLCG